MENQVIETIMARRSIRQYKAEPVARETMEEIVMAVNSEEEGGEGRADEFIEKYAKMTTTKGAADHE